MAQDLSHISKRSWGEDSILLPEDTPVREVGVAHIELRTGKRTLFCFRCFQDWVEGEQQRHRKNCPRVTS